MPRKNPQDYTTLTIEKKVLKQLKDYQVKDNESYSNIIKRILKVKK